MELCECEEVRCRICRKERIKRNIDKPKKILEKKVLQVKVQKSETSECECECGEARCRVCRKERIIRNQGSKETLVQKEPIVVQKKVLVKEQNDDEIFERRNRKLN